MQNMQTNSGQSLKVNEGVHSGVPNFFSCIHLAESSPVLWLACSKCFFAQMLKETLIKRVY